MLRLRLIPSLHFVALFCLLLSLTACSSTSEGKRSSISTMGKGFLGSIIFHDPLGERRGNFQQKNRWSRRPRTLTMTSHKKAATDNDRAQGDHDVIIMVGKIDPRLSADKSTGLKALKAAVNMVGKDKVVTPQRLGKVRGELYALGLDQMPKGNPIRLPLGTPYIKIIENGKETIFLRPTRNFESQIDSHDKIALKWQRCVLYLTETYSDASQGPGTQ